MAVNVIGVVGIALFYGIILGVGLWTARKRKSNVEDMLLAGRSFGHVLGTLTCLATLVGGGWLNGTAEAVYTLGVGLVWTQAATLYFLVPLIASYFYARPMRKRKYLTMLDPFQEKYGNRVGGIMYIPALLGDVFWCASILAALGSSISVVIGISKIPSAIISASIAVVYTLFGGLYSVACTDVIQLICVLVGLMISIPFAMTHKAVSSIVIDGGSRWIGEWPSTSSGVMLWFDFSFLVVLGSIPYQVYFQRMLACKSTGTAVRVSLIFSACSILLVIPSVLVGAIGASTDWTKTEFYQGNSNTTNATLNIDSTLILPMVLQYLTPTAVSFIGLGAVCAAVMSSADSAILSSSSMFTHNIYKLVFRQKATQRELMWVMRASVLVVGAGSTAIALTATTIYGLLVFCIDIVYVTLFPQLTAVLHFSHSNSYGALTAFIVGIILRLGGGEPLLGLTPFIKYPYYTETGGQVFPFRTLSMISALVTLVLVSELFRVLFKKKILAIKLDFFHCFDESRGQTEYELKPIDGLKNNDEQ